MQTIIKPFQDLSPQELYDVVQLRQNVFIIEQECFYEDLDGYDQQALHLLVYDKSVLAAYLRIFKPGIKYKEASLGRIIVSKTFRGTNVGKSLINEGINYTWDSFSASAIRIEAQSDLQSYYNQFGFLEEGEIYKVDGINHIQMVLAH